MYVHIDNENFSVTRNRDWRENGRIDSRGYSDTYMLPLLSEFFGNLVNYVFFNNLKRRHITSAHMRLVVKTVFKKRKKSRAI